jgi:hypothetical protein
VNAGIDSYGSFVPLAAVLQLANRMERPATAALVLGVSAGPARVRSLAWQQTARNLGYGIGGLLASLALLAHGKWPFVLLLVTSAASYVVAHAFGCRRSARPHESGERAGYRAVIHDRRYMGLALHDSVLAVGMPLWILTQTSAPLAIPAWCSL